MASTMKAREAPPVKRPSSHLVASRCLSLTTPLFEYSMRERGREKLGRPGVRYSAFSQLGGNWCKWPLSSTFLDLEVRVCRTSLCLMSGTHRTSVLRWFRHDLLVQSGAAWRRQLPSMFGTRTGGDVRRFSLPRLLPSSGRNAWHLFLAVANTFPSNH